MSPTKATKKPSPPGPSAADKRAADKRPPDKRPAEGGDTRAAAREQGKAVQKPVARSANSAPSKSMTSETRPTPAPVEAKQDGVAAREQPKAEVKREKAPSAIQTLAQELIAANDAQAVLRHAVALEDERESAANHAARLMQELAELKPELLVPLIERFARLVANKNKRVVTTCASALAPLSRIAPAKVAKQLPVLTQNWEHTTEEGKDGLVRTFAGLCTASVAYQKRLEPALARALGEAEPKLLIRWTEIVLPALKGEPHARARAVVEERLPVIPRPQAQKIADFLGIKLRPLPR
jgi:hypothetical protein